MSASFTRRLSGLYLILGAFLATPQVAQAGPACTCKYGGQSYQVNSCVCIQTSAYGPQIACCGMVLNNTSWTFTKNACPSADLLPDTAAPTELAQTPIPSLEFRPTEDALTSQIID